MPVREQILTYVLLVFTAQCSEGLSLCSHWWKSLLKIHFFLYSWSLIFISCVLDLIYFGTFVFIVKDFVTGDI